MGSSLALMQSLAQDGPAAFVVRNRDLEHIRRFDDVVVDRGSKHKAKQLSKLLLGYQHIPVIDGGFSNPGRLCQSVRTLLANAVAHGERKAYIIGTEESIFDALRSDRGAASTRNGRSARFHGVVSPQDILDRLPHEEVPQELRDAAYLGDAPQVELVRQLIMKAAHSDQPVLIIGPTGTGKENVARAIHHFGPRQTKPLVPVNTAAISSNLFEAELFGYVRGAFTGAIMDKRGLWETAADGTLFLDEIGDLDLDLQKKILRALDRNEILRVGGTKPIAVKARVVTATNRDLFSMVQNGRFRDDLYYRLRGIMIATPALHEHPQDIEELAQFLWRRITKAADATLSPAIVSRLESYRWPGNVRELHAVLLNLYAFFPKQQSRVEDLQLVFALQGQTSVATTGAGAASERELTLHRVECLRHLRRADEVIRACQVTVRPVVEEKRIDGDTIDAAHSALHYRLHELELLCLHPLLFHNEVTFEVVHRLKGKLEHFHGLLGKGPKEALRYWKKEVADEFKLALSAIFREVERVMEGV